MINIIYNLILYIVEFIADLEFQLSNKTHKKRQFFRVIYLKLIGVNYKDYVFIGKSILIRNRKNLNLGSRCAIGSDSKIYNYSPITIGDDFMAASGLCINTGGHNILTMEPITNPVTIGDRVWCGMNVTILGGVEIGDDVVIAAGAIVTKNVPSNTVVAGIPAKRIKEIKREISEFYRPEWPTFKS